MAALLIIALFGALFVDLKAQVDSLRKKRKLSLFRYGATGNMLFGLYYLICGFLGVLVAVVGIERYPSFGGWPDPILALKVFYLGFAISTNIAFLNKIAPLKAQLIDDFNDSKRLHLSNWEYAQRQFLVFRDKLSNTL